jgi:protocatechuate 3,4-dioxygenase beta subunit
VIVYAYHTDAHGIYPREERHAGRPGSRHGLLRGWVKTDDKGQYRFDTIRPAGYPGTKIPAHVHMHVIEAGRCTYSIDELLFEDDPRLTPEERRKAERGRGGRGLSAPHKDAGGIWTVARDIVLGEGIPGYPKDGGKPHD